MEEIYLKVKRSAESHQEAHKWEIHPGFETHGRLMSSKMFFNKKTENFFDYQVHVTFRPSRHFTTGIFVWFFTLCVLTTNTTHCPLHLPTRA